MAGTLENQHDDSILPPGLVAPIPGTMQEPAETELGAGSRPNAYTHPWYDLLLPDWEFYRQSYEGGGEYLRYNLFQHPKEQTKYYSRRLQRAIYPNHVRAVVDTYASQLYKQPIPRVVQNDELSSFWADITNTGVSADEFYQSAFQEAQLYGFLPVVVDRFDPAGAVITTKAQERTAGRRPYVYPVLPQDLIDWRVDRRGELEWVTIREQRDSERAFNQPYQASEEVVRTWTRQGWGLYRVHTQEAEGEAKETDEVRFTYELLEEGVHELDRVPMVVLYLGKRRGRQPVGESLIKDLAPMARRLTNLVSLIDEEIYQHVFNLMSVGEQTFQQLEKIDFSVAGVIPVYAGEAEPKYLATDVSQVQAIRAEITATEQAIRFLSGLGRQNEASQSASSGIALAYQNVDKKALMNQMAQAMSDFEHQVDQLSMAWMGQKTDEFPLPHYAVDLEPGEVEDALKQALRFAGLTIGGEAAIENAIQAARARFGPILNDPTRLEEIIADIKKNYRPPLEEGPGSTSPLP